MKRHDFDPLSFVFGLLFVAVGLPLLFSESGLAALEGRWVFPAFLIVAGAIVLATARRRESARETVMTESDTTETDALYR
jgi:branched-subunit amino acid permease